MLEAQKQRSMANRKCCAYIVAFVVFQTIIILVFALTVMRIKTPDVNLKSVTVKSLTNSSSPPSFNMTLIGEITIKNKNFGHYKFDNTTATVSYGGTKVGDFMIEKGRAKARKTRRMNVTIDVNSGTLSDTASLGSELNSGRLKLSSHAKLSGKVQLMKIIKKRKTVEMNCTMTLMLDTKVVQDLECE